MKIKVINNAVAVPQREQLSPQPLLVDYTRTNAGAPFLRWDSGDQDRIGSQPKLDDLQNNSNWFMDGTFNSVPLINTILVTLHALILGVYALLPDKTQATHTRMLCELTNIPGTNFQPQTVLIDSELVEMNAIKDYMKGK